MSNFQQRLQFAMDSAGTNASALARDCQVSRQAVMGWLESSQPRAEPFMRACRHLGVSPSWLALGEGPMSAYKQDTTALSRDAIDHARCYMILPDHIRQHIHDLANDYATTLLGTGESVHDRLRRQALKEVQ